MLSTSTMYDVNEIGGTVMSSVDNTVADSTLRTYPSWMNLSTGLNMNLMAMI